MLKKSIFLLLAVAVSIGVAGAENRLDIKRETERAKSLIEHGRYSEARHSLNNLREQVPLDEELPRVGAYQRCALYVGYVLLRARGVRYGPQISR